MRYVVGPAGFTAFAMAGRISKKLWVSELADLKLFSVIVFI
jgi:hypothetical protein